MILEIEWKCPNCNSEEFSNYEISETEDITEYIYHVYCSECGEEYAATTKNSKMTKVEV